MCRNWKLWAAVAVVAVALVTVVPNARLALPYLLIAACPLSMLVMAAGMAFAGKHREPARTRAEQCALRDHAGGLT